jgi:hypothetical protein
MSRQVSKVLHTVIRFVSISAKFGICTIVGLNGTLVKAKIRTWDHLNVSISASTSVQFRPTMVPMLNLALIETKRITVHPYPTATLEGGRAGPSR